MSDLLRTRAEVIACGVIVVGWLVFFLFASGFATAMQLKPAPADRWSAIRSASKQNVVASAASFFFGIGVASLKLMSAQESWWGRHVSMWFTVAASVAATTVFLVAFCRDAKRRRPSLLSCLGTSLLAHFLCSAWFFLVVFGMALFGGVAFGPI